MLAVVAGARDGVVDGLASCIVDEGEGGARIRNSRVPAPRDRLAVDASRRAVEHPEALGVVDGSVGGLSDVGGFENVRVDVAEGVEGGVVGVVGVAPGAQVRGEELHCLRDVALAYHVFDRGGDGFWGDGVDGSEG